MKPYDEQPRGKRGRQIVPLLIVSLSLLLSARIIVADRPERVLYVPVPGPAEASTPAVRLPIRLAGYGDSSMEWGLGAAFITLARQRNDMTWDSNPTRTDRNTYAELGCPLVNDDLLVTHAGRGDIDGWTGVGNPGYSCEWISTSTSVDVVIASFGPTSMFDRGPDPVVNILEPSFRSRVRERMDDFEAFVGVPVVWMSWVDDPSPASYEAAWLAMVRERDCWFVLPADAQKDDGIHLSPQGSLTVAAALIPATKECLA